LEPLREDSGLLTPPPAAVWQPRPKFQDRVWLHVTLFVFTFLSTTLTGAGYYAAFIADFTNRPVAMSPLVLFAHGLWYSVTILTILGCHEMGHYLACRYYDVDASLPYFLPMPIVLTGTLGAFIRIREPIPSKRMLFDIGIAGPIGGFIVAVPALIAGLAVSHVTRLPPVLPPGTMDLGEPLLFKMCSWAIWGHVPNGFTINMHPMAFAAWFGLLATALNLFPIGQLDGGHISYAVLGRWSTSITFVTMVIALGLTRVSPSWAVWAGLMLLMLFVFGLRHPRTADEHVPLDRTRVLLALFALAMFALCFTPTPIQPSDLLRR